MEGCRAKKAVAPGIGDLRKKEKKRKSGCEKENW